MKQIHDKEFTAILGMSASDRYALFLERVSDWQEVWSLRTDNRWCLMVNDDGTELVPAWPHQRFADACADTRNQEQATVISLADWMEKWLPGISKDGRQVAVFPVPSGSGIVVTAERMKSDLLSACDQYE